MHLVPRGITPWHIEHAAEDTKGMGGTWARTPLQAVEGLWPRRAPWIVPHPAAAAHGRPGRQSAERKRELGLSYSAGARTRPARARPLAPRTAARRRPSTADGGLALRGLALREHGRLSAVAPKAFFMHKNGFVDESFDNMAPVALIAQLSFSLSVLRRISKPRVSGFKLDSLAWPS